MELSPGERLIISMLCDMAKSQNIKTEIDFSLVNQAIFNKQEWALKWEYPDILDSNDSESPEALTQVVDILEMWDILETFYERFTPEQKALVKEMSPFTGDAPQFRGFDGNNEKEHLNIVHFLIGPLNRWKRFKKRDLNSHTPSLERYQRMLRVFTSIQKAKEFDLDYSPEEIAEVLKA